MCLEPWGIFSFNSIKGNGKWMGNEREMENVIYILYELPCG